MATKPLDNGNGGWAAEFVARAGEKLQDHLSQVRRCVGLLSEEQVWFRPNEHSNSVGNLLLHLRGNVTQWLIGGIDGRPFERDRRAEFARRAALPKAQVIEELVKTVDEACRVLRSATAADLTGEHAIQAYTVTGIAAVGHVVEHFAFHTGQIVTTTKWLLDLDLSLYDADGHRRDERRSGAP
jgi:hypothetical protein